MNIVPTSNTSSVTFGSVSGGSVPVTVSAGFHQRLDGSQVPYSGRTDTLSLPTRQQLSSLVRASNIVTATTVGSNILTAGESIAIIPGDPTFAGVFSVLTTGNPFTYAQNGANATASGTNYVSAGSVYYYTLAYGNSALQLQGPFGGDSWSNRSLVSGDGNTIIAVVVLNSSGGDNINSAAGATPPVNGSAVAVIRRL
jgi:hypothetical protein